MREIGVAVVLSWIFGAGSRSPSQLGSDLLTRDLNKTQAIEKVDSAHYHNCEKHNSIYLAGAIRIIATNINTLYKVSHNAMNDKNVAIRNSQVMDS